MARINTRPGRKTVAGNSYTRRGMPKKKGGIGLNTTGKNKRTFKANTQKRRVRFADGTVRRIRVRVRDLRSGVYDNPARV